MKRGSPEGLAAAIQQLVNAEPEQAWLWRLHDLLHPERLDPSHSGQLAFPAKISVLLIDDEALAAVSLAKLLKTIDGIEFHLDHAQTIPIAHSHLSQESYDVLLVDWNLGQGEDGWELIREVRKGHTRADADQAIVLWTGHGLQALRGAPASDIALINGAIPQSPDPEVLVMMLVPALAHATAMQQRTEVLKGVHQLVEGRMTEVLAR